MVFRTIQLLRTKLPGAARAMSSSQLSRVPDVAIDPSGTFKYVLIQASQRDSGDQKLIVRGYGRCGYHADIFEEAQQEVGEDVKLKCLGGGRIAHEPGKKILVYGYSQGFGRADHQKAVDILKKRYADYAITFSNDGY